MMLPAQMVNTVSMGFARTHSVLGLIVTKVTQGLNADFHRNVFKLAEEITLVNDICLFQMELISSLQVTIEQYSARAIISYMKMTQTSACQLLKVLLILQLGFLM